jgi:predicted ATPase/transcriptional regulator with XRE-family HTH domain
VFQGSGEIRPLPLARYGRCWYAGAVAKSGSPSKKPSGEEGAVPFGARLRRLREAAGLSQEELASRARLTAKAISMLERGHRKRPYPHTVRALADALELPEEERTALARAIPSRTSGGAPVPVQEAADTTRSFALPVSLTPLMGREREVEEIVDLLGRTAVRLLTLTGPGGIGKTRLGIEAAREAGGHFPDGVAFVALAPLGDAALVVPTVSRALGVREAASVHPLEVLCQHLREREFLLVLDNFEHVAEAAPEVVDLLGSCPSLSVLVTSRAPLRVRGEREYPVSPLAVPDPTHMPEAEEVAKTPAAGLFIQRAEDVSPAFELTQANAAAIAAICWRLDGLPLALELAATKVRHLDPETLLSRLDRALSAGWARDLPKRQRTMRSTLDWSHDLLHRPERELFRRLSVFAGGFTLEAAEEVGSSPSDAPDEVLDLLGRLAEQSLVKMRLGDDGPRYGMLEPVRQYALEKLEESGEAEEVRRRHARYYLALGERAGLKLKGPEQPTWLDRLETELGNLRVAIQWSIEHGEMEMLARMAWSMWKFWWLRGHRDEGRSRMEEALARAPDLLPAAARARLLFVAATLGQALGDFESTRPLIEESLALFRRLEDKYGIAEALGTTGLIALGQERYEEGLAYLEESVDLYLEVGRKRAAGAMLGFAATAPLAQGDITRARRLAERALSLAREPGGARDVVYIVLHPLAVIARAESNHERAARLLEEGLTLSGEIGDENNVAYCLEELAAIAADENELERAARLWGAAEALLEKIEVLTYPHVPDRSLHQRQVADARDRLDQRTWAAAWAEGREMTGDQAVEYALKRQNPAPEPPRVREDESRRADSNR